LRVTVPQLDVQQANLQSINIGQVAIGPITVGDLVINNVDVSMSAAQGVLQNVSVTITIHVSVEWAVHVGMPDWIPDINVGDTYDLGSFSFGPITIGNVVIPGMNNIRLHIPSLTAHNMTAVADPLSLTLHSASADRIQAQNVTLPTAGFTIAGLSLSSIEGDAIIVPAAHLDQATVGHLHGNPVSIPAFSLSSLTLPNAHIPNMSSSAPLNIPADLPTRSPGFDAGLIKVLVHLTPSALSHIDHLEITNADASATIGQTVLHNVTLPYDVLNLTLSQIGINTVAIPAFTAS
jgi:hypothetical protein